MLYLGNISWLFWVLVIPCIKGEIHLKRVEQYIGVFDDSNSYNFFEAKHVCMEQFGSSLASAHSNQELEILAKTKQSDSSAKAWIGLLSNKPWIDGMKQPPVWTDGTPAVMARSANVEQKSENDVMCGIFNYQNENAQLIYDCHTKLNHFICNQEPIWRTVFKINTAVSNYGYNDSLHDVFDYWKHGQPTYNDIKKEMEYIESNSFDPSKVELLNFRSQLIDTNKWAQQFEAEKLIQVKVSIYKNNKLEVFWVFKPENKDNTEWFSAKNVIDSSYIDMFGINGHSFGAFALHGAEPAANGNARKFEILHGYSGCLGDSGWLDVSHKPICLEWKPKSEASVTPQIVYSINNQSFNGLYTYGIHAQTGHFEIGDTLVVSIKTANQRTTKKHAKKKSHVVTIVVVCLLIAVLGGAGAYFYKKKKEKEANPYDAFQNDNVWLKVAK